MRRLLAVLLFQILCLAALELALRWNAHAPSAYYLSFREAATGNLHFPYGDIHINRDGFADPEFGAKTKPRIGYFGGSIAFGVGAGMGYRLSDRLRLLHNGVQHLTFGKLNEGLSEEGAARLLAWAKKYRIDQVVYLLDLDDVFPNRPPEDESVTSALFSLRRGLDALRGRSYLYDYLRAKVSEQFLPSGFGAGSGYEFFPRRNAGAFRDTAERIRGVREQLAKAGISLLVVLLPYEMQVSEEAARVYAARGIRWESGFVDGSAQATLRELLGEMPVLDASAAFVERPNARARNRLGEFFVYDRGEKLDWVHPNRLGHARLAQYLAASGELLGSTRAND